MANNPTGEQLDRAPIALGVFVTLAVILRYLARWKSKADFAVDDVLIAISVLPQYAMIVISAECTFETLNVIRLRLTSGSGE